MDTTTTVRNIEVRPGMSDGYREALRLAARLLTAKIIRDKRNKAMCICLEVILDNGDCPVHGKSPRANKEAQ